ncbi:hypothetical protein ACP70R_034918 [Stipagrostis hirtigluma subsp. patula]
MARRWAAAAGEDATEGEEVRGGRGPATPLGPRGAMAMRPPAAAGKDATEDEEVAMRPAAAAGKDEEVAMRPAAAAGKDAAEDEEVPGGRGQQPNMYTHAPILRPPLQQPKGLASTGDSAPAKLRGSMAIQLPGDRLVIASADTAGEKDIPVSVNGTGSTQVRGAPTSCDVAAVYQKMIKEEAGNSPNAGDEKGYSNVSATEIEYKIFSIPVVDQKNFSDCSADELGSVHQKKTACSPEIKKEAGNSPNAGDEKGYSDVSATEIEEELEKMKKYNQDLEILNADLESRLEFSQGQIKDADDQIRKLKDELAQEKRRSEIGLLLAVCHDVFLCPYEVDFMQLHDLVFGKTSVIIGTYTVHESRRPGKQRLSCALRGAVKIKRLSPLGKIVILGIIEDVYRLHRNGLSLDGNFTLDSFYWTRTKKVKLHSDMKSRASKRGRSAMIADYHQIYRILLQILSFHEENFIRTVDGELEVPPDLKFLLDLLDSEDPVNFQDLIRYNISLMTEVGKKSHFLTLFDRLKQFTAEYEDKIALEKEKSGEEFRDEIENKPQKVLSFIKSALEDWQNIVKSNDICKSALGQMSGRLLIFFVHLNTIKANICRSSQEGKYTHL